MTHLLKKIVVTFTAVAVFLMGVGFASAVQAETSVDDLEAQIQALMQQLEDLKAEKAEMTGETTAIEGVPAGYTFDRNLSVGMSGTDVKYLQKVLNASEDTMLADSGVGSPGEETEYFGPLTKAGVVKFQEKYQEDVLGPYDLTQGTGYVGKTTRAKLNELIAADVDDDDDDDEDDGDEVTGEGLEVDAESMSNSVVPQGASNVDFVEFTIEAGEDAEIENMVFTRKGVGSSDDFSNVYLYEGDVKLTTGKSVISDSDQATFNNLGLEMEEGEERTLTLVAEVSSSATAGDVNYFELTSMETDVDVSGLPVSGASMTVSGASAGSVTMSTAGTISAPTVGEQDVALAEFKLEAGPGENIDVYRVALTNAGSANLEGIENITLWRGSNKVVSNDNVSKEGDVVTLVFDEPFYLSKGDSRTFTMKGDINGGLDSNDNFEFYLDENVDLKAVGRSY